MPQTVTLKIPIEAANDAQALLELFAQALNCAAHTITGYHLVRQSIDARSRQVWRNLTADVFVNEAFVQRTVTVAPAKPLGKSAKTVAIIGAGPAGLFAALRCLELGLKPIVIDRGKDVRNRRRDLALLNKTGTVNPESNYCYGEGGAGTYSDGKLYTRSNKRGNIAAILNRFVQFGASDSILYEAHPHIGTNKLPQIITAMRQHIENAGGDVLFNKKMTDLVVQNCHVLAISTADGDTIAADAFLLATGHSANDVFELLQAKGLLLEAKPFALGVRVEHPQDLIDHCLYKGFTNNGLPRPDHLPAAAYSLVNQAHGRGVFSFCMCPGGIIAPAATSPGHLVVNGWSPSKRNNPFANSGIVVECKAEDVVPWLTQKAIVTKDDNLKLMLEHSRDVLHPLLMLRFQQRVEQQAFVAGGGKFVAPAQCVADFAQGRASGQLPPCSYIPGVVAANLGEVLPAFVYQTLQEGFKAFGKKMPGYYTNDAIVVATESRTSSPVRIPRVAEALHHPQWHNFYPCGEGAGYAGGIVSAAMDGEKVAEAIATALDCR